MVINILSPDYIENPGGIVFRVSPRVIVVLLLVLSLPVVTGSCIVVEAPSETWYTIIKPTSPTSTDIQDYAVDAHGNIYIALQEYSTCPNCIVFANMSRDANLDTAQAIMLNTSANQITAYRVVVNKTVAYLVVMRDGYYDVLMIANNSVQPLVSSTGDVVVVPAGNATYLVRYEPARPLTNFQLFLINGSSVTNVSISMNTLLGCYIDWHGITYDKFSGTTYISAICYDTEYAPTILVARIRGTDVSVLVAEPPEDIREICCGEPVAYFDRFEQGSYVVAQSYDNSMNPVFYIFRVNESFAIDQSILLKLGYPVMDYVFEARIASNRTHLFIHVPVYAPDISNQLLPGLLVLSKNGDVESALVLNGGIEASVQDPYLTIGTTEIYPAYEVVVYGPQLVVHGFSFCNVTAYPSTPFNASAEPVLPEYSKPEYTVNVLSVQLPSVPEYTVTPVNLGDYISVERVVLWSGTCPVCVEPETPTPTQSTETATAPSWLSTIAIVVIALAVIVLVVHTAKTPVCGDKLYAL